MSKLTTDEIEIILKEYLDLFEVILEEPDNNLEYIENVSEIEREAAKFGIELDWIPLYEIPPDILFKTALLFLSEFASLNLEDDYSTRPKKLINKLEKGIEKNPEEYLNPLSKKEKAILASMFMLFQRASYFHLKSISVWGSKNSIYALLQDYQTTKNDLSLFKAIYIDNAILTESSVRKRVMSEQLKQNNDFFDKLSDVLNKTYPPRTKKKLDKTRILELVLGDLQTAKPLTQKQICGLFIDKLKIYSNDCKDPCGSLFRYIQRLRE